MKILYCFTTLTCLLAIECHLSSIEEKPWSIQKITQWYQSEPWSIGCNFIPSTAINQMEMWQPESFDRQTIDNELGLAESIGFNSVRVFLHYLPWENDSTNFKKRINEFLTIASNHHISTIFVLFDDCWNGDPQPGKQPEPRAGVHNSGWVQCPGQTGVTDQNLWVTLEKYVKDIISTFRNDRRIIVWDLYNEPGNSDHGLETLPLLKNVFIWARAARPSQPLTAGIWNTQMDFEELNTFQINSSDVISYHCYGNLDDMKAMVDSLRKHGRPLICTEYMARPQSTFTEQLPFLKKERIGAFNWGLVSGKTQTIYPWDSWEKPYLEEPKIWFHDIFRKDGSPYDENEVRLIRELTGKM